MLVPFTPAGTVSRTVTSSSANVALPTTSSNYQLMVTSAAGGNIAFIKFGTSTVEAAVTDFPILPGTQRVISFPANATHVAAIGSATTTLYFTVGNGQ